MKKTKKIASFFAGVGGIDIGFENAEDFEVVYANEFDKNARITYQENFNDIEVDPRDIREVSVEDVPDVDILLAGFPCQPFSVAGYQHGFEDDRGDLFFDTLRIILGKRPEVVFLENVKNMVTHDKGNTFKVIREALEINGYYLKWAVLNATDYGNIPQNRERIYIIAFSSKKAFDHFEFPEEIPLTNPLHNFIDFHKQVDSKYYYNAEKNPTFYDKLEEAITSQESIYQWRRQYVRENKSGVVPTLTANMGTGGHNVPLILADHGIRKLTPRETFNIQGYPSDFILPENVADGQLYKQAGNSVAIPVIERLAENIKKALKYSSEEEVHEDRYALTYTRMFGNHVGESYKVKSSDSVVELESFAQERMMPIITDEEYLALVKNRKEYVFYMLNEVKVDVEEYA